MASLGSMSQNTLKPPRQGGRKQKRKPRRRNRGRGKQGRGGNGGDFGISRNPGERRFSSTDNQLSLTRSQFTATSPLNYFTVSTGSTPGGIRVRGRELIGATSSTGALAGAFSLASTAGLNPVLLNPASFPRLSAYNPIYEFYKFHKADFMFQANQPTTATGEIMVAADYDAKDVGPASAVAMMRNISSTMANIYSDCSLQVLGELARVPRFATAQGGAADTDQINQAAVFVAFEGVTTAGVAALGYLICQYDVEFYTPQ